MQKFVLHWGEMGSRWGVNRSVAQIHALLFLASEPMTAEDITETLGIARSNVSTSLKELINWELISVTHVLGDRRDHFVAIQDVWTMLTTILNGRKRREIDPTIAVLQECENELESDKETPKDAAKRIKSTLEFMEEASQWYEQINHMPRPMLLKLMRMGAKVSKIVA